MPRRCAPGTFRPCIRPLALTRPYLMHGSSTRPDGRPSGARALSCPHSPTPPSRRTRLLALPLGTAGGGR
eukprot:11802339-Alexandrium_andersonii.AAC.1